MDIVIAMGAAASMLYSIFGIQSGLDNRITVHDSEIAHIRSDVARVERQAGEADKRVLEQLGKLESGMNEIKKESASGRKDILDKLDKLIERELDIRNGGPRQP